MHFIRLTELEASDVMEFLVDDPDALDPSIEALSFSREEAITFFEGLVREAINSAVSYVVKTDSNKIVAVRLSTFRTREEAIEDAQTLAYQDISTAVGRAQALLRHLNQQFWNEADSQISKVYYLVAVVVAKNYRHTDIVDQLIHHNMDEIRTMGAQGMVADAAIFHSHCLLHRLGYRVVAELEREAFSEPEQKHKTHDGNGKVQLVFKEIWREESAGAHVVL
ncbi:hypothetical protein Q1695_008188 [Nippostrongylus brasiliensis]|nr:hypothetical protein Q1695_008188 [Nippostrongylus brasiliensis]